MSEVKLNWSQARVSHGKLEVELAGDPPDDFKHSFESTARLLGGGDWGRVRLKKRKVTIKDVGRGSEAKLHHYLESVVEQANANHRDRSPDQPSGGGEPSGDSEPSGLDAEMTEAFRSFAHHRDEQQPG